jgi:hypothetical protein
VDVPLLLVGWAWGPCSAGEDLGDAAPVAADGRESMSVDASAAFPWTAAALRELEVVLAPMPATKGTRRVPRGSTCSGAWAA